MGNMQMLDKVRQINALHIKLLAEFPHQVEVDAGRRFEPAWTTR